MSIRSSYPYIPAYLKEATQGKSVETTLLDAQVSETNIGVTSSFLYDPLDYPLKSTQQIDVDWSKFENHTFFSSAEVKVNEAFNTIINGFPFDGSQKEVEGYIENLTGFDKYVFDSFPRRKGALLFSGTTKNETPANGFAASLGTHILVKDKAGFNYPALSRNQSGLSVLTPGTTDSLTFEMHLKLPNQVNDTQVVLQKQSDSSNGYSMYLSQSASTANALLTFCVTSGSFRNSVSTVLDKGSYNHVVATLDKRDVKEDALKLYVNEKLSSTSNKKIKFGLLPNDGVNLLLGSGSSFYDGNNLVVPMQTLSGTMDEFRMFHESRDVGKQILYANKGVFSTDSLKLYFRFNEPPMEPTESSVSNIVLDSSGKSLHSSIQNFTSSLRIDVAQDEASPMTLERPEFTVVLFPSYSEVANLNTSLLSEAKSYDAANPNIITNLIPKHYLLEGFENDGFNNELGDAGNPYGGTGGPGQGVKGSTHLILSFLYIWSKFFDEIKIFTDAFGTLKTVDYSSRDSMPDNFLEDAVRSSGFYLPKFFTNSEVLQYAKGEDVPGSLDSYVALKKIQATLTRRVLMSLPGIVKSKGTQHSIKSFLRAVGIDPENSIKIREFGGATTKNLTTSRVTRTEVGAMVDFLTSSFVTLRSPLSSSRIEPGFPNPRGTFITGSRAVIGTTVPSDGLLTSGSWSIEGFFKIPAQKARTIVEPTKLQSLFRLYVTGSTASSTGIIANVLATPSVGTTPASLKAYVRPGMSAALSPVLEITLPLKGDGLFDGERWYVSLGRTRNDQIGAISSSYSLRAATADWGEFRQAVSTSSPFQEEAGAEGNALQLLNSNNVSGSFIGIGNNQTVPYGVSNRYLNNSAVVDSAARVTDFEGWASNVRFWSKDLTETEWKSHAKSYNSTGVDNPLKNYNFTYKQIGSFEKLRVDSLRKQADVYADANGSLEVLDYSKNNASFIASGYDEGARVFIGDVFSTSQISPAFDEASEPNKVRIRSFQDLTPEALEENPWATQAPSYANTGQPTSEEPIDDTRLSIEFSIAESLSRDISNMFSNLETINDAIGSPELAFSQNYPTLENLRDIYFNRLSDKIDIRRFFEFYRWFDVSISTFIEQLVPQKTRFKGTNFVIESHMLERHKKTYSYSEMYMGSMRSIGNNAILVQQIVGSINKY